MQMKLNSRILKDEIQNAYKLENKNPKDLEKQEEICLKHIKRNQDNIEFCLARLRDYNDNKRKLIANIRTIIEDENNHEDGLISNKLKENKEEEYNRECSHLNLLIKQDFTRQQEMQIKQERNFIKKRKDNYKENEEIYLNCIDKAIEKGRKKILELTIRFLQNNNKNQEDIQYLQKLIEESK